MRIVAGKYRGKTLIAPDGKTTRPTADRARESVFNIVDSRLRKAEKNFDGLRVFDCFAGSGALGLEALSRGAAVLYAAENDKAAQTCFRKNSESFKDCRVTLFSDALSLPKADKPVDLVLMDPPYRQGLVAPALSELDRKGWISDDTLCVVEIEKGEENVLPETFTAVDSRTYGRAKILIVLKIR